MVDLRDVIVGAWADLARKIARRAVDGEMIAEALEAYARGEQGPPSQNMAAEIATYLRNPPPRGKGQRTPTQVRRKRNLLADVGTALSLELDFWTDVARRAGSKRPKECALSKVAKRWGLEEDNVRKRIERGSKARKQRFLDRI